MVIAAAPGAGSIDSIGSMVAVVVVVWIVFDC